MTHSPRLTPGRRREQAGREQRLARALRENLQRRKEQSRARAAPQADPPASAADSDEPAA